MSKITINTNSKEQAKEILNSVYEADRQGGLTQDGNGFAGSVLTAKINEDNSIEISSGYYQESTLRQMFD